MLGEQNLSSTFPNMLFKNIQPLCGLFGLYGIEGQTIVLKSGKTENQEPRITGKPTQYRKIISPKE